MWKGDLMTQGTVTKETLDRNALLLLPCFYPKYRGIKWIAVCEQDPGYVRFMLERDRKMKPKLALALQEALADVEG